jgi:hypothetical protein
MVPLPWVMGSSIVGAEITTWSRMMASCCPTRRVVMSPNSVLPSLVRSKLMTHPVDRLLCVAVR